MIGVKKIKKGQIETYTTADIADSVDKRYQTDNQQTYNDATSSIQTQLNAKLTTASWIDYSATSTIVGWSSFTTKGIFYKIIDNVLFCNFYIEGISNATTATFTLPHNNNLGFTFWSSGGYNVNNTIALTTPSRIGIATSSNIVIVVRDMAGLAYTASGTKGISGQILFKIN